MEFHKAECSLHRLYKEKGISNSKRTGAL